MTTHTLTTASHAPTHPAHWRLARLGEFITSHALTLTNGFAQGGFNEDGLGVPHLRPFNVNEDGRIDLEHIKSVPAPRPDSPYWVRQGDIIFNNTNSEDLVGKTAYFPHDGKYVLSNHMTRIRVVDSRQIDAAWLAYQFLLQWDHRVFKALCRRHVGQASISLDKLSNLTIPLPPLAEQRAIARILRAAQDAIAARRRQVTLERERKAALMQRLFTHGVRGEPTKQTEIGEMPQSWQVVRLGAVSRLFSGGTPSKERTDWWNGSIPWASPKDLKQPRLRDVQDHVTEEAVLAGSRIVPAGTVFIVVRGMILAKDVPIALTAVPMAFNQDMKALIPVETLTGEYLLYVLQFKREDMFRLIGTSAHGTRRMGTDALERFLIPIPSTEEQEAIATVLHACETIIAALEREIALHEELFRALLEELMSGRLSALLVEETASGKA